MPDGFLYPVIRAKVFTVLIKPLSHKERQVLHSQIRLNPVTGNKLTDYCVNNRVKRSHESFDTTLPPVDNRNVRKVNTRKREVAPARSNILPKPVRHNSRPAAHGGYLRLDMTRAIILKIERSVQKFPVREQAFRRDFHRQLKQVVVRVAIIVVDTILHLEDLYGENRGFPMPKPRLCSKQNTPDNKPLLFSRPCTIVNGRKRNLRSGT